jgi:predicted nucleic acid-binding protein
MTFVDLIVGDAVFLDANTFVYHFAPDPNWSAACGDLLQRIQNQEIAGYTSASILGEVALHSSATLHLSSVERPRRGSLWPRRGRERHYRRRDRLRAH